MAKKSCINHPDKESNLICKNCGAPICLECERIFRKHHLKGSPRYEQSRLCPSCYNERIQKQPIWEPIYTIIIGFLPLSISIILFNYESIEGNYFFQIAIGIVFGLFGLSTIFSGIKQLIILPKEKQKTEKETNAFFSIIHQFDENCYLHPQQRAVRKCEHCHQNVCEECNRVYKRIQKRTVYGVYHLCPLCYNKKIQKWDSESVVGIVGASILIFIINSFAIIFNDPYFWMGSIFMSSIALIGIYVGIKQRHKEKERKKAIAEETKKYM